MSDPLLSIVVPCYNEQDNIAPLCASIAKALGAEIEYEVILVDDASTDATMAAIREAARMHAQVRWLSFEMNAGQSAATDAGLRACRGRYIAMLDADLQNDPADIPDLLAHVRAGDCDVACGSRVAQRKDNWLRRLSSRVANSVRSAILRDGMSDSASSLRVFRCECVSRLRLFNGMHRFFPALFKMDGFLVREYPARHHDRYSGQSKYGLWNRLVKVIPDLLAVRWMQSRGLRYKIRERS